MPPLTDSQAIPAVQYVRMSTEHQQYSTSNQEDVIRDYATARGYRIVRTYADEGKSGLNIAGRDALRQMIADVQSGQADYKAILVYDISRWGRFQDADESAYYEYLCKQRGIEVHYCAEQFENDGGPTSTIIKSVKRAMAGEYSRELSSKVFKGQCRLIELGYRQGGPPGYGLRRLLIGQSGESKGILARGEQKSLQTDRVILIPGPEEEMQVVRRIYRSFIDEEKSEAVIAAELNAEGCRSDFGRLWNRGTIRQVLTNEKYIGNNVYNRTSFKLKKKHVVNVPEMWVRKEAAFSPLVSAERFYVARGIIQERTRRISDDDLLAKLRTLMADHPTLSGHLIDSSDHMPPSATYRTRFGSLLRAYQLAGYQPPRDYGYLEINRRIRGIQSPLVTDLLNRLTAVGATVSQDRQSGLLLINGEFSASLTLSRCRQTAKGSLRWKVALDGPMIPDITILGRMDESNERAVDYYLFPVMDIPESRVVLCETNGVNLDTYQFESLDFFTSLAARRQIEVAA